MISNRYKSFISELIGTFMLVFAGTGAIIVNEVHNGAITHLGIALTFGLIVLTVIYALGECSGAHINPAVTIAFWAAKRFPGQDVFPYVLAQCLGATLASFLLYSMFPENQGLGGTLPSGSSWQSFVFEFIMTWWLMIVILGVSEGSKEKGLVAGIVIGSVVALEATFGGPVSGASMNPARSLGPALASGQWQHLWLYLVAPTAGAVLAVHSCRFVQFAGCCETEKKLN